MTAKNASAFAVGSLDRNELSSVLKILKTKAKDLSNDVKPMLEKLRSGEMQTSKGVSFLEVKYQVLLQYITELAIFAYAKLCGKQINGTDLIESLVELRVILERMKPIEAKLKYQVDKLVRNSVIGSKLQKKNKEEDPLAFKPNPTGLLNMDGQDEQSENNESDEEELVSSNVYRPPKMAPVSYNELGSKKSKKEKDEQRMMERTSRSRMMKDLMVDMNDAPEESGVFGGVYDDIESGNVMDRKIADKTDYEENNYVRLQVTRKEKKHLRNRDRMLGSEFENLGNLGNMFGMRQVNEIEDEQLKNVLQRSSRRKVSSGLGQKRSRHDSSAGGEKTPRNKFQRNINYSKHQKSKK